MNFGKIKPLFKRKKVYILLIFLIFLVLIVGGFLYYQNNKNKNSALNSVNNSGVSAKDAESRQKNSDENLIFNKNYELYQMSRIGTATQYSQNLDYENADRLMQETLKNVPEDKVIAQTYMTLWDISSKKNDPKKAKEYAKKVVEILQKTNGDKDEIKQWQKSI